MNIDKLIERSILKAQHVKKTLTSLPPSQQEVIKLK